VSSGEFDKKLKFRILREDELIAENLTVASLKKYTTDVNKVEKGSDCGICFANFEGILNPFD
jgi:translation initiation factor IF-2